MSSFAEWLPILMFATLAVLLFSGYPVALVIGGVGLLYGMIGQLFGAFSMVEFFIILPRIWGGIAENLVLVAVPMFIFMGSVLEKSGVADELLKCMQILMRSVPGGLALSVTAMGTIMAATTGIVGASVIMMTVLALPAMLERGYSRPLATGTIAASGTLGILIPPSIMLVVMGDLLQLSIGDLFLGALFPGLLLSVLYLAYILTVSWLQPSLAPPLPRGFGPQTRSGVAAMVMRSFIPPVALIAIVLGSLFAGWATVTEASGVGAAGALLLAAFNRRLSLSTLQEIVNRSTLTIAMVFLVLIGATAFSYVFRSLGGDDVVIRAMQGLGLGPWGTVLLVMAVIFVLGFFFDWIEITLIVLPVFAPIVAKLDFAAHVGPGKDMLLWFAILVAVNLQTSFLTPPFGFALFFIKGAAPPAVRMGDIYRGVVPFVSLQLFGLALVMAFPRLVLWLPRRLLD